MKKINLSIGNHCYYADWFYKITKGVFGFAANQIHRDANGDVSFKTPSDLTEEEKGGEQWGLFDGDCHAISCASLLIGNEFRAPLEWILTPGMHV